jgi:hypothetical protein
MPCLLREAEHVMCFKELKYLGQSLLECGCTGATRVKPFVTDTYGGRHYGEWYECNPAGWVKR